MLSGRPGVMTDLLQKRAWQRTCEQSRHPLDSRMKGQTILPLAAPLAILLVLPTRAFSSDMDWMGASWNKRRISIVPSAIKTSRSVTKEAMKVSAHVFLDILLFLYQIFNMSKFYM